MRFIGNKTRLLGNIEEIIDRHVVSAESFCDIFSGSVSVARYFKSRYEIYSNDLLYFSYCLQRGTIQNPCKPSFKQLTEALNIGDPIGYFNSLDIDTMESLPVECRFFQCNYAPRGGRMYMTDSNALRVDYVRNTIEEWHDQKLLSDDEYFYLVSCVVEGIPYISNIAGTYGAYNKFWDHRSYKTFELIDLPVVCNNKNNVSYNMDGVDLLSQLKGDILYIDPPYNERQYLPNYHILETAARYDNPALRGVTGQRPNMNQSSDFCSKKSAVAALDAMVSEADFRYILLSYNTEGIMSLDEIESVMKKSGIAKTFEVNYIPYRRFKSNSATVLNESLKEIVVYIEKEV